MILIQYWLVKWQQYQSDSCDLNNIVDKVYNNCLNSGGKRIITFFFSKKNISFRNKLFNN